MQFEIMPYIGLQYFADGAPAGDAGDGGATADGAVFAVQQGSSLEDLGVPRDKAERHRSRMASRAVVETVEAPAEKPAAEAAPTESGKLTLEDVLKDPDENAKMQSIVKERLRKAHGELEKRKAYDDVLSYVAAKAGMKDFNIESGDAKALLAAVEGDASYFEDEAFSKGISTEELIAGKKRERESREQEQLRARAHYSSLRNQAEAMREKYADFDLDRELNENPRFFNMTSMTGGATVEEAYRALHFEEILEARVNEAARQAAESVTRSIRAGSQMPVENGMSGRTSLPMQKKPYNLMTPEEQRAYYFELTGKRMSRR